VVDSISEEPTDKYLQYYTKGIDYFQQSLEINQELDNKQQIAQTLNNIGFNYMVSGKLNLAQNYLEQALAISQEVQDANELATTYLYLGQIYLHKRL